MNDPFLTVVGVFCAAFAVLVVIVAVYSARRERRRRDRMRRWADRSGWALNDKPNVDWGRQLPGGNRAGAGPAFSATLSGRHVQVAEYSVTDTADGATPNTRHYIVAAVRLNRALPETAVEPRGPVSRLASKLLGPGEVGSGDREFDLRFRIRTTEPASLGNWLSPALIAAHLTGQIPSSWSVRGNELLSHQPGRLDPHQIAAHAAAMLPLARLLDGPDARS